MKFKTMIVCAITLNICGYSVSAVARGPKERHENRVERRAAAHEKRHERRENRQDKRHDRREDRRENRQEHRQGGHSESESGH